MPKPGNEVPRLSGTFAGALRYQVSACINLLYLTEGQLALTVFLLLDPGAEQPFEITFAHEAIHRAVIDYRPKIETSHLHRRPIVHWVIDHVLNGRQQHIRHALEGVGLGVTI